MFRSAGGDPDVHRITTARRPHSDDLDHRINRYLLSMLIRTICFLLIFVVHGPLRWGFAAAAVFLPYVAVVMANTGRPPRETPTSLNVPPPERARLEDTPRPGGQPDQSGQSGQPGQAGQSARPDQPGQAGQAARPNG